MEGCEGSKFTSGADEEAGIFEHEKSRLGMALLVGILVNGLAAAEMALLKKKTTGDIGKRKYIWATDLFFSTNTQRSVIWAV